MRCFQHVLGYAEVSVVHVHVHLASAEGGLSVVEGTGGNVAGKTLPGSLSTPVHPGLGTHQACLLFLSDQSEQVCSFPRWVKRTQSLPISSSPGHVAPLLVAPWRQGQLAVLSWTPGL